MRRSASSFMLSALVSLALVAGLAAACSSGGKDDRAAARLETAAGNCDAKGVTSGPRREGTCIARGVRVTVVNRDHWLRGPDYDVLLRSVVTHDDHVSARLRVRNNTSVPQRFDAKSNLVFLLVDGRYFNEDPAAETEIDAFLQQIDAMLPNATETGTVSFTVPQPYRDHLRSTGANLVFVSYEDEGKQFPTGTEPMSRLGYIRLWK